MKFLFNGEQYEDYNIYSIRKSVDTKRSTLQLILAILIILTLCLIIYYTIDTTIRVKRSNEFLAQIVAFQKQQEEIKNQQQIEKAKKEEERKSRIPQLTEVGKENIRNIYETADKKVYLTFDDGPSMNTIDILDILKEDNIKATFFVLGVQVQYFPETTNRLYNEGHYIANHGYTHRYSEIYQSPETVLQEYNQCNQIVADTIHVPEYNSHLFRFPGGSNRR